MCLHSMVNFVLLVAEIGLLVWDISTGFASWQRYCSDVAQRKPTKLCTVFGCLLGWYTTYTLSQALAPLRNFARCKIHFASSKSCTLLYWQCYCTPLEQWARAKLCGVEHRAPPIFCRVTITLGIGPHSSLCMKCLGTAERICTKFTRTTCLVPRSDEFEGQG